MTGYDLPLVNACLNGTAGLLLLAGYAAIRAKWIGLHKVCMLSALTASTVFLGSYVYYHVVVRGGQATPYTGEWRSVYLLLLRTHMVLAALVAVLAPVTAGLGLGGRWMWHKRIARWTLPIWLYVSVTGVVIYLILKDSYPKS